GVIDLLGWEQGPFVLGMSGLPAALPLVLTGWRRWRWWLDDVGGRRLGGSRGVLAGGGELLLEASHGGLQLLQLSTLLLQLRLQALALGTGSGCCFGHALCTTLRLSLRLDGVVNAHT